MDTVLIVGATGAQGAAISRFLSSTGRYNVLVFTRSATSSRAVSLAALPNVKLVVSAAESGYDVDAFVAAARGVDYVVINTDGFALGEQAETYWGIRLFELSARAGVKHLIYSGLDYIGKKTNYDPDLYVGHYEGKARVEEWIHAQGDSRMRWTIIRSGPYMELLSAVMAPAHGSDGSLQFQLPLDKGAIPFIHLGDFGRYVDWALSNADESAGKDFGIATAHVTGQEIAETCTKFTGKPSEFVNIPVEAWNQVAWKGLPNGPDTKIGFQTIKDDRALLMSYGENFAHWWGLYKASAGNTGLIRRDYAFLDRIVPDRVKSLAEWMEKVGYTGEKEEVLNIEAVTK